jgi:hypothetical protein
MGAAPACSPIDMEVILETLVSNQPKQNPILRSGVVFAPECSASKSRSETLLILTADEVPKSN